MPTDRLRFRTRGGKDWWQMFQRRHSPPETPVWIPCSLLSLHGGVQCRPCPRCAARVGGFCREASKGRFADARDNGEKIGTGGIAGRRAAVVRDVERRRHFAAVFTVPDRRYGVQLYRSLSVWRSTA